MPFIVYGSITNYDPRPPPIYSVSIDSSFVDVTSNLIWWYGLQTGDISSNNIGLYNYVTQQYDASLSGTPTMTTSQYRTGNSSLALTNTTTVSKYIQVPNINMNSGSYTFTYWINNSNTAIAPYIVISPHRGLYDYENAFLLYSNGSNLVDCFNTTNINFLPAPPQQNDGKWHLHIWNINTQATTLSNIHNVNIDNGTYTSNINNTGYSVNGIVNYVGYSSWDSSQYINGYIDDFRLYSGNLIASQIQSLWDISNANCYFTSYSVTRDGSNMTINWSGTNIACISISNKTQNLNYGRLTTSGQTYSGIAWTSNDLFYLTPYNSTTVATAKAGQATRLFKIS